MKRIYDLAAFSFGPGLPTNLGELYVVNGGLQLRSIERHMKAREFEIVPDIIVEPFILRPAEPAAVGAKAKRKRFDSPVGIKVNAVTQHFRDCIVAFHADAADYFPEPTL